MSSAASDCRFCSFLRAHSSYIGPQVPHVATDLNPKHITYYIGIGMQALSLALSLCDLCLFLTCSSSVLEWETCFGFRASGLEFTTQAKLSQVRACCTSFLAAAASQHRPGSTGWGLGLGFYETLVPPASEQRHYQSPRQHNHAKATTTSGSYRISNNNSKRSPSSPPPPTPAKTAAEAAAAAAAAATTRTAHRISGYSGRRRCDAATVMMWTTNTTW